LPEREVSSPHSLPSQQAAGQPKEVRVDLSEKGLTNGNESSK
jgi:hypothetical protein